MFFGELSFQMEKNFDEVASKIFSPNHIVKALAGNQTINEGHKILPMYKFISVTKMILEQQNNSDKKISQSFQYKQGVSKILKIF